MSVHEAKTSLSRLLEAAERGEEVVIARAGTPAALLVAIRPHPVPVAREPGAWRGRVHIAADFDVLPDDIAGPFGADQ